MFDYHMHSTVSFDGHDSSLAMAMAAKAAGLKEICFTDHIDHDCDSQGRSMVFDRRCTARNTMLWRCRD